MISKENSQNNNNMSGEHDSNNPGVNQAKNLRAVIEDNLGSKTRVVLNEKNDK